MANQGTKLIQFERNVRKPIIILGCARSGTTMLGDVFSRHPDVALWHELRMIWMYGHAYQSHDELGADDLTNRIGRHIDRKFSTHLEQSGRSRFAEKTPSNVFRIPFIHALYPDCRIVNIIRDGRHVVRSISQLRNSKPTGTTQRLRKRFLHTPIWEWPAYAPRFFRTTWRARVMGKPMGVWGPLARDWREWENLPRHLMIAEQWRASVAASIRDGRALPPENYYEFRYEDLMQRPVEVIREALTFCELTPDAAVLNFVAETVDPNRTHRWKDTLTDDQEREVTHHLQPMLRELGYLSHNDIGIVRA